MRQCPSCGQLTLDIVPGRHYLQCTRYSCGHREPVVDPKDARIAELEAQVARVRAALDGFEYDMDCGRGIYRQATALELRDAIRAALEASTHE